MELIIIGGVGTVVVLAAYFPQIKHLVGARCSAGISRAAFLVWLLGYALLASYAIFHVHDPTFIALQVGHLLLTSVILIFAYRYRGMTCPIHAGMAGL